MKESYHSPEVQHEISTGFQEEDLSLLRESVTLGDLEKKEGWDAFDVYLSTLGLLKKDAESYLSSVSKMHGTDVFVRRANVEHVFSSLRDNEPLRIQRLDSEPNAAILGSEYKDKHSSHISGIEAAMDGGFSWLVEGKVAGVFGFTTDHSNLKVSQLDASSPSLQKRHGEVMRGIEGSVSSQDILFVLLRIHKSVFPEDLCTDGDFDEITGERHPFVLRLYAKNRQIQ